MMTDLCSNVEHITIASDTQCPLAAVSDKGEAHKSILHHVGVTNNCFM